MAMKLSDTLAEAFNKQVTAELEASLVYLQLSYILDDLGLVGMRDWMKTQSEEELTHAQQFADHMLDRDATPQIGTINSPALKVTNAISGMIRDLAAAAQNESDFDSRPLLDTFLQEQIEEESTVKEILDRLRMVANDGSGLLRMDAELGAREDSDD